MAFNFHILLIKSVSLLIEMYNYQVSLWFLATLFICPFEKRDVLSEHLQRAGRRRPQGFRSLSQRVFIQFLSNLVNMLVGIISRPSSITSHIPIGSSELWPLNCSKLGFPLSMSKSFHQVFIKLGKYVGGHNISTKFYYLPNPRRHS